MRATKRVLATRTEGFTESVIREMTRLNAVHGGINLAQGFPNFPAPDLLKDAAKRAIDADINQYAITWGSKALRDGLAKSYGESYGMAVDPETMLTVTCGSTEAMVSTLLAIVDPGDEVYEHIRYGGPHIPIATLDGMAERTVTISGASKTFSVTGWRVGWIVASPQLTGGIRKVHDFVTVGAPAPLQEAVAAGLTLGAAYYRDLSAHYRARRDTLLASLDRAGF